AGRAGRAEARSLRERAFAAFDRNDRGRAEPMFEQALAVAGEAERSLQRAGASLETVALLGDAAEQGRTHTAEVLYERALLAESLHRSDAARELLDRMTLYDREGALRRKWDAPGQVGIETSPPGAEVELTRYVAD